MTHDDVISSGWVFWYQAKGHRVYRRHDRVLTLWPNGDIGCVSLWAHVA